MSETLETIRCYLGNGGTFNPELMEHEKVRDLIMDCRDDLTKLTVENQSLREQLKEAIRKLSYGCASEADFIAFHNRQYDLTEERDSLRSQNQSLLADKERLDWLQTLDPESRVWYSVMDEMDIRKACDAAMKKGTR